MMKLKQAFLLELSVSSGHSKFFDKFLDTSVNRILDFDALELVKKQQNFSTLYSFCSKRVFILCSLDS